MMKNGRMCVVMAIVVGMMMFAGTSAFAQYYQQPMQPQMFEMPYSPQQYLTPVPTITLCPQATPNYWQNPQCVYQQGLQLVKARRYYEAIQIFQAFLQYYPQSSLADNALYWTGECYYAMRQYGVALAYFQQIPAQYPRANKVPDSLLKTALCYFSMNQNAAGCQALNMLLMYYPKSEPARKAWRWQNRCGWGGGYQNPCYQYQQPVYPTNPTYPSWNGGSSCYPTYPTAPISPYGYSNDSSFPKNY
jgi:tol-pal system protein YbgF